MEGGDASGSAKCVRTSAPWCKALCFGPVAHGAGGARIPTGVAVLALGRIHLTLLTMYALWRLDTAGMPRRAAAMPADAMEPGDAPRGWSERHGHATFERPGLTRPMPWRPSRLQSAVPPHHRSRLHPRRMERLRPEHREIWRPRQPGQGPAGGCAIPQVRWRQHAPRQRHVPCGARLRRIRRLRPVPHRMPVLTQ